MKKLATVFPLLCLVVLVVVVTRDRAEAEDPQGTLLLIQVIGSEGKPVEAIPVLFNPKEYTISKTVPWQAHKSSKGDAPTLEFTSAEPVTLSMELFFDTYDTRDVREYTGRIQKLARLDDKQHRPPTCLFTWGNGLRFKGVLTEVRVRFTKFLGDGTPVRATCNVTVTEAEKTEKAMRE